MFFAILVNRLVSSWPLRAKYVDDTNICEVVPRCSPSYLQILVNEINEFATCRGMQLNPKKCKEMEINFLKHQCVNLQPLVVGDAVAKQVDNCKLLWVYISSDLSWNEHVDFIVKKATKRLFIKLIKGTQEGWRSASRSCSHLLLFDLVCSRIRRTSVVRPSWVP